MYLNDVQAMFEVYQEKLKSLSALKALADLNGIVNTYYLGEAIELCENMVKDLELIIEANKPFCVPPNLTYCKLELHPDFDCNTCKWKTK